MLKIARRRLCEPCVRGWWSERGLCLRSGLSLLGERCPGWLATDLSLAMEGDAAQSPLHFRVNVVFSSRCYGERQLATQPISSIQLEGITAGRAIANREWLVLVSRIHNQSALPHLVPDAVQAWEQIRERLSQALQNNMQTQQERRIQAVLGHPALRTIADRDGRAIVEVGELIVPQAVERAKRAGKLECLLGAAYRHIDRVSPPSEPPEY